ncbi:MAG: hypothetical protein E6Q98_15905 [Rhodospirillaceae bacterium]|nr:MAG: hypothetical protein E6Q98_15905 [Rhodospirillaceae bacterium]
MSELIKSELGERPKLLWLPITQLEVDPCYQRDASGRRSQQLIRHIAQSFDWSRFQVLTVTPKEQDEHRILTWLIIDGQHRTAGALLRGDIDELPCIVMDLPDRAAQAKAFVALNRDRVAINRMQMHHAALAAGDVDAQRLSEICAAAGVEINRYPVPRPILKPHQTMAIATMQKLLADLGPVHLERSLRTLRATWPTIPGSLNGDLISALSFIFASTANLDQDHLQAVLRKRDPEAWVESARQRRYASGGKLGHALQRLIVTAYNAKAAVKLPDAA